MATVQIRNLDDSAYEILRRRAAASGRSLQEYLRLRLEEEARQPTVDEVLQEARADLTRPVAMEDIVAIQLDLARNAGRSRPGGIAS
jgi:plasmid stability protein